MFIIEQLTNGYVLTQVDGSDADTERLVATLVGQADGQTVTVTRSALETASATVAALQAAIG